MPVKQVVSQKLVVRNSLLSRKVPEKPHTLGTRVSLHHQGLIYYSNSIRLYPNRDLQGYGKTTERQYDKNKYSETYFETRPTFIDVFLFQCMAALGPKFYGCLFYLKITCCSILVTLLSWKAPARLGT